MKIAVVGTGYVGLVSGACFAEMGLDITCVDVDRKKIDALNNGIIPIYEPGLEELVKRNVEEGRLHFTTELTDCLDKVEVVFSAVGTPPDEDGSADLKYVLEVARTFGRNIKKYTVLVTKSTVPVGTAQKVKAVIREEIDKRGCKIPFDVASNPEFLKEGAAIKDFMSPDRVVVGVESERARKLMTRLYRPFLINNFRVLFMDIPSAEMTKYAANAMLATRISFMNEIANLCDLVGANVEMVRKGIGSDARIGSKYVKMAAALSFAQPEILSLPEETLTAIVNDPAVADYKFNLEDLLRGKPHTLTKAEEKLLASFGEVMSAPSEIYHNLEDADLLFDAVKDGLSLIHI